MPAINPFPAQAVAIETPALRMLDITPSDANDAARVLRMVYVGTGGNVDLVDTEGNIVLHKNVPSGSYLGPFRVARVKATRTTATDLIGYE